MPPKGWGKSVVAYATNYGKFCPVRRLPPHAVYKERGSLPPCRRLPNRQTTDDLGPRRLGGKQQQPSHFPNMNCRRMSQRLYHPVRDLEATIMLTEYDKLVISRQMTGTTWTSDAPVATRKQSWNPPHNAVRVARKLRGVAVTKPTIKTIIKEMYTSAKPNEASSPLSHAPVVVSADIQRTIELMKKWKGM